MIFARYVSMLETVSKKLERAELRHGNLLKVAKVIEGGAFEKLINIEWEQ